MYIYVLLLSKKFTIQKIIKRLISNVNQKNDLTENTSTFDICTLANTITGLPLRQQKGKLLCDKISFEEAATYIELPLGCC